MIHRRTRARLVFLGEILMIPIRVYQWRRAADEDSESVTVSLRWLLVGGMLQAAYCWAYDRDLGTVRTKRWRRTLLAVFWSVFALRVFPRSEAVLRSFSIGGSIGRIGYRLWYGVLHPLPDIGE